MSVESKRIVLQWSYSREIGGDDERDVYVLEGRFRRHTVITDEHGADWLEIDADIRDGAVIEAVLKAYELGRVDGEADTACEGCTGAPAAGAPAAGSA